jgi:hypothetical protein
MNRAGAAGKRGANTPWYQPGRWTSLSVMRWPTGPAGATLGKADCHTKIAN